MAGGCDSWVNHIAVRNCWSNCGAVSIPTRIGCSLNSRTAVLAEQAHAVLKLASKPGIRSEAEKRQLTEGWLELALSCAKISVKYEADVLKQQQKQEQAALQQEMG